MRQAALVKAALIAEHGHPLTVAGERVSCFPVPERLASIKSSPGLSAQKVERLNGVARAALAGRLDLHGLGDTSSPEQVNRLTDVYRPFRMWVCFLLRVAANRGLITGVRERQATIRRAAHGRAGSSRKTRPPTAWTFTAQ